MLAVTATLLEVILAVQISIIGYSNHPPLQAIYLGLGALLVAVGLAWAVRDRSQRAAR